VILVDTDVLIANLRGRQNARAWLREARNRTGRLAVSVVTNTEIIGGMRSAERREVYELLDSLRPMPLTDAIARRAGELRRAYRRSHASISVVVPDRRDCRGPRSGPGDAEYEALPHGRRSASTFH